MKTTHKWAVAGLIAVTPALGFLEIGDIVFDPTNLEEAIVQTTKLIAQIEQLRQQYEHMKYMATYFRGQQRYHAPTNIWQGLSAADTYGRNAAWLAAVNSGAGAHAGWSSAVMPVAVFPVGFGGVPGSQTEWKQKQVATLELMDGTGVSTLDTVGRVRASGPEVERAMQQLEADTLNDSPDANTVAARMATANAISLLNAKSATDANKLLVAQAEASAIRLRQERDAAAMALKSEAALRTDGEAALRTQHESASDAMRGFRLP